MAYSALFEKLLEKRGLDERFLHPKYEDLSDPFLLSDMEPAVERISQAVDREEKILIYGDYDVDGVTATTVMKETLKIVAKIANKNVEIITMLPDRFVDGYGMSERAVERAKTEQVQLVITVDCGSNNTKVIEELTGAGVDVIVTDHHELLEGAPEKAVAVVNPKRADAEGSLRDLCGAGVAFFVARALVSKGLMPGGQEKWLLDLAMIGTICDSMELARDNRIITKFGMTVLSKTRRVGLQELMKVAEVKRLNAEAIGFQIGPRLNAAGRMETAELSLRLLATRSRTEAASLAAELNRLNQERRRQQNKAVSEVEARGISDEPVIVAAGEWHEGIVGIIAGRLTERYRKPAFVLGEVEGGILKGSGRSFGEFNLADAISECQKYLISGGGHAGACGLKLEKAKLPDFIEAVNRYYRGLGLKNQERFLEKKEDLKVGRLKSLSLDFMGDVELLEPFGSGNAEPVFLLRNLTVVDRLGMGAEAKHLRLIVRDEEGTELKLVGFFARGKWFKHEAGTRISALATMTVNEWQGTTSVEGRILEIFPESSET